MASAGGFAINPTILPSSCSRSGPVSLWRLRNTYRKVIFILKLEKAALMLSASPKTGDFNRKGSWSWPHRSPPSTTSITIASLGCRQMPISFTRLGSSSELIRNTSCLNSWKKLPTDRCFVLFTSPMNLTATTVGSAVGVGEVDDGVDGGDWSSAMGLE